MRSIVSLVALFAVLAITVTGLETGFLAKGAVDLVFRADQGLNQVDEFTNHQTYVQRILAILLSTTSIVFCVVSIYFFFAIDPKRLIFRHQLIMFLLLFDLLKACILLLYPSRVLTHYNAYYNTRFCQVVGFFSATAIEGADFAILTFAIHTYLLIFRPSLNVKVGTQKRVEGGLYSYRYYIYGTSFLVPLILASLAFIDGEGYYSFVCWCYLPQDPVWYRMVLSWVPRYVIVLVIFACYSLIYYHVIKEIRVLGGVFTTFSKHKRDIANEQPTFYSAFRFWLSLVRDMIIPKLLIPDEDDDRHSTKVGSSRSATGRQSLSNDHKKFNSNNDLESGSTVGSDSDNNLDSDSDDSEAESTAEEPQGLLTPVQPYTNHDIQLENLKNFRKRQKLIKKQMKSIFIYPLAYIFLWLFPFVLYVTQIRNERIHGPIYWLNCMGAFMQPLNGFVDSLVFFYREQPWKYTVMNKFVRDHEDRMNSVMTRRRSHSLYDLSVSSGPRGSSFQQGSVSLHHPSYAQHSLSANLGVDITKFSKWRLVLNNLNLPLFQLPTERNLTKYQRKFLQTKLERRETVADEEIELEKHDFSNVLQGSLVEDQFRSNLENFSLNFNNTRPSHSLSFSGGRKNSVMSHKSFRSRQLSIDPNEPVILEGQTLPISPNTKTVHNPSYNTEKYLTSRHSFNSGNSTMKVSGATTPSHRQSESAQEDNDDMDFLEFLRNGPPQ